MIKIFTNEVFNGWSPLDLKTFLGGSEESVVLFSEALVKAGYDVIVYHTQNDNKIDVHNGVRYMPRDKAECYIKDIFITFKDYSPWVGGADAAIKIHWTADAEQPWDTDLVDHYVSISDYHKLRNTFVDYDKNKVIDLGIDIKSLKLDENIDVEKNTILYCSSPDRGLYDLLKDWTYIRLYFPEMKLKIAYGFGEMTGGVFEKQIYKIAGQDGVEFIGRQTRDGLTNEYKKAEYWCLPLNRADSELFCINAIKSRLCGCIPIVYKIGALRNTVGNYIKYSDFINGKTDIIIERATVLPRDWSRIVKYEWMPLLKDLR